MQNILEQKQIMELTLKTKDGWMICDFTSFSTVFKSYQEIGQMIMKSCVQWKPVYGWQDFASSGARTQNR